MVAYAQAKPLYQFKNDLREEHKAATSELSELHSCCSKTDHHLVLSITILSEAKDNEDKEAVLATLG